MTNYLLACHLGRRIWAHRGACKNSSRHLLTLPTVNHPKSHDAYAHDSFEWVTVRRLDDFIVWVELLNGFVTSFNRTVVHLLWYWTQFVCTFIVSIGKVQ